LKSEFRSRSATLWKKGGGAIENQGAFHTEEMGGGKCPHVQLRKREEQMEWIVGLNNENISTTQAN